MANVNQYLDYAETALVAYGHNLQGASLRALLEAYFKAGLSEAQARRFNEKWRVLSQTSFNLNGFSAVLLQNRETGEKVLTIRGTNDPMDWATDLVNIANFGTVLGMPQYYSLEAYYAQLVSTGLLGANEQMTVTGHSLGGFLAQAFVARHDAVVSAAYTFNAPGMGGSWAQALEFLGITDASASYARIVNVRASDGLSATAGLGQMLGSVQQVRIEAGAVPTPMCWA